MDCSTCEATGLVQGTRQTYDNGVWKTIPYKGRATCPDCKGLRQV